MSDNIEVFIVEPSHDLQFTLREALRGFDTLQIHAFTDSAEALLRIRSSPQVDLVITEAVMPSIDGVNLVAKTIQQFPRIKTIILTEYDLSDYMHYLGTARLVAKPFKPGDVRHMVRSLFPELRESVAPVPVSAQPGLDHLQVTQAMGAGSGGGEAGLDDLLITQPMAGPAPGASHSTPSFSPVPPPAATNSDRGLDELLVTQPMAEQRSQTHMPEWQPIVPSVPGPAAPDLMDRGLDELLVTQTMDQRSAQQRKFEESALAAIANPGPFLSRPTPQFAQQRVLASQTPASPIPMQTPTPPNPMQPQQPPLPPSGAYPPQSMQPSGPPNFYPPAAPTSQYPPQQPPPYPQGPQPPQPGAQPFYQPPAGPAAPFPPQPPPPGAQPSFYPSAAPVPPPQAPAPAPLPAQQPPPPPPARGNEISGRTTQYRKGQMSTAVPERLAPAQLAAGIAIGSYTLTKQLPDSEWGPCWIANQAGVNRRVRLTFFSSLGPHSQTEFASYFQRRASQPHPNLLTIFEVAQIQGLTFIADEYWTGGDLSQWLANSILVDARTANSVLSQTLAALRHLSNEPCRPIRPNDILVSETGVVKLNHLHASSAAPEAEKSAQMALLGSFVTQTLSPEARRVGSLQSLIEQMLARSLSVDQAINLSSQLEIQLAPERQLVQSREHEAAVKAAKDAERQHKRFVVFALVGTGAVVLVAGVLLALALLHKPYTDFKRMFAVPGGQFITSTGQQASLKEFYADEYEVTIYQYAQFLKEMKKRPNIREFAHPEMPKDKSSFQPAKWAEIYKAIQQHRKYFGDVITYNSPVFNVDFWDAWAYAKWAGKRLPTALEWERMAMGRDGKPYPWGAQEDKKRANTGEDYYPGDPSLGGEIDGHRAWSDVDTTPLDVSECGVKNLAGNVSEWTSTPGEDKLAQHTMLVKGGSFASSLKSSKDPFPPAQLREATQLWLGFRLVSDTPPAEEKK